MSRDPGRPGDGAPDDDDAAQDALMLLLLIAVGAVIVLAWLRPNILFGP